MNRLKLALFFLLIPDLAYSMSATSVTLSDTADANGYFTVKIKGTGFGEGPTIMLYDNFNNQTTGADVALNTALIGQWTKSTSYQGAPKIVDSEKGKAFQIHDFIKGIAQIETVFPQKVSNLFISYSVVVPEGRFFSGAAEDYKFPDVSSWKFTWIADEPNAIASKTKFNICTPTHGGSGTFLLAGNSVNHGWISMQESWSWHKKNYMSFGILPNELQPQILPGLLYFQLTGKPGAPLVFTKTDTAIFPITNTTSFDRVKFPGWFGNGDTSNFDAYYDDIYVATGKNAFARVEFSDAASLNSSTVNLTMPIVSWTNTDIEFKLHKENLQKNNGRYIRIYDAANKSISAILKCPICPKPPSV